MSAVEYTEANATLDLAGALAEMISMPLSNNKSVVWLISGGSSLPVAVEVAKLLSKTDQSKLSVTLVDEKHGPENHDQSNWRQLHEQGFALNGAQVSGILHGNDSLQRTADRFEVMLAQWLSNADFVIGQFGIGDGYHTGGIVARTIAAQTMDKLTCGYDRNSEGKITVTPGLIAKLDVAFINSMGMSKKPLVRHFCYSDESIENEPTQALKHARRTMLYSDVLPSELISSNR